MAKLIIDSNTKDTGLKLIRPDINKNKGINLVQLFEVNMKTVEIKGDSPMIEFRGMTIPALEFVWLGHTADKDEEPPRHIETFMPISFSNSKDKVSGKSYFDNMLIMQVKQILHIVRRYVQITETEYNELNVFNENFDETDGNVVVGLFAKFYTSLYDLLHKTTTETVNKKVQTVTTAVYKNVGAWLKLVYNAKIKRFTIPGSGTPFYEIYIKDKPTTLALDLLKKETIVIPVDAVSAQPAKIQQALPPVNGNGLSDFNTDVPADFFNKPLAF